MEYEKLIKAACRGDIEALNNYLEVNPLILVEFSLAHPKDSLLHIAVKAEQPEFVRELLKKKLELAYELNKDGLRPIDVASILGNVEIIRDLLSADPKMIREKRGENKAALHYAVIYGRIDVVDILMNICGECITDVTDHEETALHLALKNNKVDVFCRLLNWVESLKMEFLLNLADCDGNTLLHIAASRKQLQCIKHLVGGTIGNTIQVNAKNSKGLTAMDLLDMVVENPNDFHLKKILAQAGSLRAQDITADNQISPQSIINQTENQVKPDHSKNWFEYFKFNDDRDSPSDARNTILVVAALIATISFQAGINPPSGIIKQRSFISNLFILSNTLGFSASCNVIFYLTRGFPFQAELKISMYTMSFSYGLSITTEVKINTAGYLILVTAIFLPLMVRYAVDTNKVKSAHASEEANV